MQLRIAVGQGTAVEAHHTGADERRSVEAVRLASRKLVAAEAVRLVSRNLVAAGHRIVAELGQEAYALVGGVATTSVHPDKPGLDFGQVQAPR